MTTTEENSYVLVVDDDAIQRALTVQALRGDFETCEAGDGAAALEKVGERSPDIVLLDINMPGMDGFEVCRKLRSRDDCQHLPVLMMTGLDDHDSIEKAYQVGATSFVTKTNNWTMLRHHLRYMLRANRNTQALVHSEERYALAARGANDGLWDWDIADDSVYYSPRWKQMLGYEHQAVGSNLEEWLARVHPGDHDRVRAELEQHISGRSDCFHCEYRIRNSEGEYLWMLCRGLALFDQRGDPYRMSGSQTDISERKAFEEQLRHDALHDALTQLPNRTLFMERVEYCIGSLMRRRDYTFAVIFVDLDRFKTINDSLGHGVGDSLLVQVSSRVAHCLRSVDTLARLGGDEFAILCDDVEDVTALTRIVERIQRDLLVPFDLEGQQVVVTASIGITLSSPDYNNADEMLRDADTAMYRAKSEGRSCYKIFDPAMHTQAVNRLQLETEMRNAIECEEFEIYYQPIVSTRDGQLVGFEALLRWNHPQMGVLLPGAFLDLAEETGLIVVIGRWLLERACRELSGWQTQYPQLRDCYVSINVAGPEVTQSDVVENIGQVLEETGLPAPSLRVELTESVLIQNPQVASDVLTRLIDKGVRLALDDFGTGHSSLNYLHRFPFDSVKIDRSFIREVDGSGDNKTIVKAIIDLAHNLGLRVVAEGSETSGELEALAALHCEYTQGHIFSRPLRAAGVADLLSECDGGSAPVRTLKEKERTRTRPQKIVLSGPSVSGQATGTASIVT